MPFTLAHPALIIPLHKSGLGLSMTGLIIGSMVPDLEFLIQLREVENIGHHWSGIFIFNLPVAILLTLLYHNLLRNCFVSNLPQMYRKRFIQLQDFDWNHYAMNNKWRLLLSILIGVLSHFVWDAFTHHDGFVVELIPTLAKKIMIMNYELPVYLILQVLFSILGMAMVHLQVMRLPIQKNDFQDKIDYRYWIAFVLLLLTIASLRLIIWPEFNSFGGMAIAITGSIFYSWLMISILFKNNLRLKKVQS